MGLFELCLISLLSPQEPQSAPPHAIAENHGGGDRAVTATAEPQGPQGQQVAGVGAGSTTPQDPPVRLLQAAEAQKDAADPKTLLALAVGEDGAIAERATWLLGHTDNKEHKARLPEVLKTSPHPAARLQAMQTIRQLADVTATPLALHALDDDDRRVRTVAAQLLGRLKRPTTIEPLLALIHNSAQGTTQPTADEPATDVQAALLALADIGSAEHLLRMATSIDDGNATGTGEALAYVFQTLSPKLDNDEETTVLMAVLDHKETLVRRYAITRLTELDNAAALSALDARLANEGDELRPLIEVAIAQLRNDKAEPGEGMAGEVERAKANAQVLWARFTKWWNGLQPMEQGIAAGIPALLFVALLLMRRAARRRAHAAEAQAAAAWVQPSDEYVDERDADYDDEGYDEDFDSEFEEEFEGGQFEGDLEGGQFEGDFDEDAAPQGDQPEYDTAGWEDDDAAPVGEGTCPEDELFR